MPAAECRIALGVVSHAGSARSARFGELAERAAGLPLPGSVRLKTAAEFKLIGQPQRRREAASKQDGSARFGIDSVLPGMLYASVLMCPTLARHPRHRAVLQRAADRAGWGQPLAPAADGAKKARGIALHSSFGSTVAQVAEVSLDPKDPKRIRVHRVVAAIDCGLAVNPNGIAQQMDHDRRPARARNRRAAAGLD